MGRSISCLKIITCARDPVDSDDLEASEPKGSSNKCGWSFQRRSARHRVVSNTVISETPSSGKKESPAISETLSAGKKESPESASVDFQALAISSIPEKTSGMQGTDEIPQFSISVNSKSCETIAATEDDTKFDVNLEESDIVVIQAAIRRFLAQREMLKHKNVVKLQAAVRGYLVRRHAVGTLRCIQAIVKMQGLVRARHTRRCVEVSSTEEKLDEKYGKDNYSSKLLGKQNSGTTPQLTYISIEKLLSNRFARQLLQTPPRAKPINIKCDSSRSDSAWKWLERWMSASSTSIEESHKPELIPELHENDKVKHPENQVETVLPSEGYCESTELKSTTGESAVSCLNPYIEEAPVLSESKENMIPYNAGSFDIQASQPTSSLVSHNLEQPQPENTGLSNSKENSDLLPNQTNQSDSITLVDLNSLSGKPELETEQPKRSMKKFVPEQPEIEGRKFAFGSRKATNPAFNAAQSKFEDLGSPTNSARTINASNQDFGVESCTDTVLSGDASGTREIDLADNSVSHASRVEVGGSECGTELSISSTLDSPDRSEVGTIETEQHAKVLEEQTGNPKSAANLDVEAKVETTIPGTDLPFPISVQPEKYDHVNGANGEPFNSVVAIDSLQVEQKLEENASDLQIELESQTGHPVCKSSPEASPRSHITGPESQGTPSSLLSAKAKKTIIDKNGYNPKRKSLSAAKKFPQNLSHDSGVSSILEQLPKDHKVGKRRNSFGSTRPDHVDQEPRDSSSSSSLPNYMQLTESARAKAYASNSPRSSPDVQDKDSYIKKRQSLPGANGRQGSPRIQRSMSQAQHSTKGNGTHPPQERKWHS